MTISKDIKFDCAHMLSNYEGKCANLHGHTYHGTVILEGDINPETGMLLDYNTIKDTIDVFDHAIIFSATGERNPAETDLYYGACRYGMRKVELVHGKSTAETLARDIVDMFITIPTVKAVQIKLSETDGSWTTAEAYK